MFLARINEPLSISKATVTDIYGFSPCAFMKQWSLHTQFDSEVSTLRFGPRNWLSCKNLPKYMFGEKSWKVFPIVSFWKCFPFLLISDTTLTVQLLWIKMFFLGKKVGQCRVFLLLLLIGVILVLSRPLYLNLFFCFFFSDFKHKRMLLLSLEYVY